MPIFWTNEEGNLKQTWASANWQTLDFKGTNIQPDLNASYFMLKTR
jgi:hypothetical protein